MTDTFPVAPTISPILMDDVVSSAVSVMLVLPHIGDTRYRYFKVTTPIRLVIFSQDLDLRNFGSKHESIPSNFCNLIIVFIIQISVLLTSLDMNRL